MTALKQLLEETPSIEELDLAICILEDESPCMGTCELDAGQFISEKCDCKGTLLKTVIWWLTMVKKELEGR
jgi:uncharacterized protein YbbK (DUF523 family)